MGGLRDQGVVSLRVEMSGFRDQGVEIGGFRDQGVEMGGIRDQGVEMGRSKGVDEWV